MAEQKVAASPTKLVEEKSENEGLSPYFGFPSVGKMHSLFSYTELVQYLCLMYRQHRPKDPVRWGEEKTSRDLVVEQTRGETQNRYESVRISTEEGNWS